MPSPQRSLGAKVVNLIAWAVIVGSVLVVAYSCA